MSTSAQQVSARAVEVRVTEEHVVVTLADGRVLSVPLAWFPRLFNASPRERERFELLGDGEGIHWPLIDEDLSVAGLLRGNRSAESGLVLGA
jgi:hypothetical protein